jgi:hypothetical protein
MWEPLHLSIQWASTACYRDSCTFIVLILVMLATIQSRTLWSLLSSATKKRKDQNIQDFNFSCGSVWVRNLVSGL